VPVAPDQALSIGMFRYYNHLNFGLHADPDAFPEAERLPELIADEVRALGDRMGEVLAYRPRVAAVPPRTPVTS